ncbi:MAG TPA: ADP-ribosylglycohydrolase family protein [Terriglobia bacterium]|nr:ADP-ribosylglycohydrolase family protein [Terriglobia bacterium]
MGERDSSLASPPAGRKPCLASRCTGAIWGSFIGDALAMPVHWYYNVAALRRDYGVVRDYLPPRNPHPDSYLGKALYHPVNAKAEVLHDQAKYWGQPGIHYHQLLRPGENTLNLKLAAELLESLAEHGHYDANDYLRRYLAFMLTPGRHRDTYVESAHRAFFQNYARGRDLFDAAIVNHDIGGLVALPGLIAGLASLGQNEAEIMAAVHQHLSLTHRGDEIERAAQDLTELLLHLLRGAEWNVEIRRLVHSRDLGLENLLDREDVAVVGGIFSAGCPVTGSFPAVLYLALKYFPNFEQALVANTNLGGDNCHRGAVLGGILGAVLGQKAIPDRWLIGLIAHDRLRQLINKLCQAPSGN